MKIKLKSLLVLCVAFTSFVSFAQTSESTSFEAGAAKVEMTPSPDEMPEVGFSRGIRDKLYVRAIVINNGITSAALVSVDAGGVSKSICSESMQQIEAEFGIPQENIVITATHIHSGMRGELATKKVGPAILNAVKAASEDMQPARIGYKTGTSYINVNRNAIDPITRLWTQAPNYDYPSDKTVAVVSLESVEGDPIAVYYNYGMHANMLYMSSMLSAGTPGETSKYIEKYYDDKIVALFNASASGDQNPRYLQPMSDIERIKSELALSSGRAKNSEEANKIAGFQGGVDDIVNIPPNLYKRQEQMIVSMGQFLGEEVIRVMKYTLRYKSEISIFSADTVVTCPGRVRTSFNREGSPAAYEEGEPEDTELQLLVIGDIALAIIGADPFSKIAMDLKEQSPYGYTIMVGHANGLSGGYTPSDDAFGMNTFQVLGSKLEPGCAEISIINGFLDLMDRARK